MTSSSPPTPGQRTYSAAREEIRSSLDRMQVDHVDLIQLHCLVHPAELDVTFGEHGALRAAVEAPRNVWCGSSGSPATGSPLPRCTCAASSGSLSTRCCFHAHVAMQDEHYTWDVGRLITTCRDGTSRYRRSRAFHADRGVRRSRRQAPGTSHWSNRSTSTSLCTGRWGSRVCFSTASATSSCSRGYSRPRSNSTGVQTTRS